MKKLPILMAAMLSGFSLGAQTAYDYSKLHREKLGRGLVAVRQSADSVTVGWRYFSSDPEDVAFDLWRDGRKVNAAPLASSTHFTDFFPERGAAADYTLTLAGEHEALASYTLPADAPMGYIEIPIEAPAPGVTPAGERYDYTANDASVGDVDGDGEYEIILKWNPSNAHDNAHDGYTGNVFIDCIRLDGERLWRIDMGRNVRAGAHYTQFMVYDFDCDGRAEMIVRTADGTTDALGHVIGDSDADYRYPGVMTPDKGLRNQGRIFEGPEWVTVFSGATGEALASVPYIPARGDVAAWGDERANRSDRFLAAVAYLDGQKPSAVMCRGYYTRSVLAAFDWDGRELTSRWVFDSDAPGCEEYAGQGNHNLRVADVDSDGCDEIVYGQCAVDHDGTGLYSTGMDHGDAMHLTAFLPGDNSLQVWGCHENKRDGSVLRDARTGKTIFQIKNPIDVGRCMAADIDPTSPGLEMWSIGPMSYDELTGLGGLRNPAGGVVCRNIDSLSVNSAVWWDGDLLRELLDRNHVDKFDPATGNTVRMATFAGAESNNGTKANACLSGDLLGDWREEVLLRSADGKSLRLYVSPHPTPYRFHTFLEDVPYRISIATQNVAYNQPTQPGFYFGSDFAPGTRVRGCVIR